MGGACLPLFTCFPPEKKGFILVVTLDDKGYKGFLGKEFSTSKFGQHDGPVWYKWQALPYMYL